MPILIDNFENWEKLVRAAETLEGGLNRNSSPQAIATTRDAYDRFLAKFPLLFGYWKKYADLEFSIAGTEAAEMVRLSLRMRQNFVDGLTGF
jgi:pre-mRNA-processing factor 39